MKRGVAIILITGAASGIGRLQKILFIGHVLQTITHFRGNILIRKKLLNRLLLFQTVQKDKDFGGKQRSY